MTRRSVRVERVGVPGIAALGLFTLLACSAEPEAPGTVFTPPHCADAEGDLACRKRYRERPYCSACVPADEHRGCVVRLPAPTCRVDLTAPTTTSGSTGLAETTTGSGTTSRVPPDTTAAMTAECDVPADLDPACEAIGADRPYCVEQTCVSCADAGGHEFCAGVSESAPVCGAEGRCVACDADPDVCTDDGTVCGDSGACTACAYHQDCASGACHLAPEDPEFGRCFAATEVVYVDRDAICPGLGTETEPNCSLAQAVASTPMSSSRVIHIDGLGSAYAERIVVPADTTVALVAQANTTPPVLSGASGHDTITVADGTLYTRGLRIDGNPNRSGIRCTGGTVRIDTTEIRGNDFYGLSASAPCSITFERSSVFGNNYGGIRAVGGTLRLVNATVARNGAGTTNPAIASFYGELDVLYSTIAGNRGAGADSLQCLQTTGAIRNSVVVGADIDSIDLDCFTLTVQNSAIDTALFVGDDNVVTPAFNANWFIDAEAGDFRLAAPPLTPFGDVAQWQPGDPELDADGTPRPQAIRGYAGVDEP